MNKIWKNDKLANQGGTSTTTKFKKIMKYLCTGCVDKKLRSWKGSDFIVFFGKYSKYNLVIP